MSPDPYLGSMDLSNPQSLNRYSYVGNAPTNLTDPLGLFWQSLETTTCVSIDDGPDDCKTEITLVWFNDAPGVTKGGSDLEGSGFGGGDDPAHNPSETLLKFLSTCEGFRSKAYPDTRGNCTIGYGHLLHLGRCTAADGARAVTQPVAMNQFAADVATAATDLNNNLTVPLNQGQFDAMVSLTFNMGMGRLQTHDVWHDVNAGNLTAVPGDIRSLGAGGPGIPARRANEANMFQNGVYADGCYSSN